MTRLAILLLSALGLGLAQVPAERAIATYLNEHNTEGVALLEKAVNINSGTNNHAGVRAVGQLFRSEFDALGFKTTWVDGASFGRAGHLVADHPGPGPRILLIGHLDTVFEPDSPFQKFERVDANTAKGPGIIDMKGGDVVIIQAMKALKSAGALASMNVIVVMTGDEEEAGRPREKAREALVTAATGAQYAIGFEDGDGNPSHAVTARRGTEAWTLTVKANSGHSSQIFTPEMGNGAIFETAAILNTFREKMAGEPHLTFNPGSFVGGTTTEFDSATAAGKAFGKTNVVAAETVVNGDMRALTLEQFAKTRETMTTIVAAANSKTAQATITFGGGYPPLAPTPGNEALLAIYNTASQDLGLGSVTAVSPDRAGAADVSFIATQVKSVIDAVGLKGHDDHSPAETADLRTLSVQATRAAVTLLRLSRK